MKNKAKNPPRSKTTPEQLRALARVYEKRGNKSQANKLNMQALKLEAKNNAQARRKQLKTTTQAPAWVDQDHMTRAGLARALQRSLEDRALTYGPAALVQMDEGDLFNLRTLRIIRGEEAQALIDKRNKLLARARRPAKANLKKHLQFRIRFAENVIKDLPKLRERLAKLEAKEAETIAKLKAAQKTPRPTRSLGRKAPTVRDELRKGRTRDGKPSKGRAAK